MATPHPDGDPCAHCRWPIDFGMGEGLNVAINEPASGYHWMHSVCADFVRGWA